MNTSLAADEFMKFEVLKSSTFLYWGPWKSSMTSLTASHQGDLVLCVASSMAYGSGLCDMFRGVP